MRTSSMLFNSQERCRAGRIHSRHSGISHLPAFRLLAAIVVLLLGLGQALAEQDGGPAGALIGNVTINDLRPCKAATNFTGLNDVQVQDSEVMVELGIAHGLNDAVISRGIVTLEVAGTAPQSVEFTSLDPVSDRLATQVSIPSGMSKEASIRVELFSPDPYGGDQKRVCDSSSQVKISHPRRKTFGGSQHQFTQITVGGGASSSFSAQNTSAQESVIRLEVFDVNGTKMNDLQMGPLQPNQTETLTIAGERVLTSGWARLTSDQPFTATEFLRLSPRGSRIGVLPSILGNRFRFFGFVNPRENTGFSVANPGQAETVVTVRLLDGAEKVNEASFQLGPLESRPRFLSEVFPNIGRFAGSVEIVADPEPVTAIALEQNASTLDLTTIGVFSGPEPEFQDMNFVAGANSSHWRIGDTVVAGNLEGELSVSRAGMVNGRVRIVLQGDFLGPDIKSMPVDIAFEKSNALFRIGEHTAEIRNNFKDELIIDGEPMRLSEATANFVGELQERAPLSPASLAVAAFGVLHSTQAWLKNESVALLLPLASTGLWCKASCAGVAGVVAGVAVAGCGAALAACAAGTVPTLGGIAVPCAIVTKMCATAVLAGGLTAITIIIYEAWLQEVWG